MHQRHSAIYGRSFVNRPFATCLLITLKRPLMNRIRCVTYLNAWWPWCLHGKLSAAITASLTTFLKWQKSIFVSWKQVSDCSWQRPRRRGGSGKRQFCFFLRKPYQSSLDLQGETPWSTLINSGFQFAPSKVKIKPIKQIKSQRFEACLKISGKNPLKKRQCLPVYLVFVK